MRFTARLVLATIGILLFSVVILIWTFRTSLHRELEASLARTLEGEAELIRDGLPTADPASWQRHIGLEPPAPNRRITVLDRNGRVLADNSLRPSELAANPSLADRPEIRAALRGRVGRDLRGEGRQNPLLFVAVPGSPIVRVAASPARAGPPLGTTLRAMIWAGLLAVLVGSAVALLGGRAIVRPLEALAQTTRTIPTGTPVRFPRSRIREVNELVLALREMTTELAARFDAITAARAESAVLVESMVEGVLATDARGRIVTANSAARRLLGYGPAQPLPDLPQLFRVKAAREVVEATVRGESVQDRELEIQDRVLTVNARPLPSGGAVLVFHDLTRMRQLEVIRRDFVANVSHELKTPLTSIAGYAETLLTEDIDPATRIRFLETVLANARRMHQLVDDQLSLARIEGGRWQPAAQELDPEASAREAWAPRASRAEAAGIRFRVEVLPGAGTVRADPEALRQILGNLYDNAIRYTPEGGQVTCRALPSDGGVTITVSDTGPGIGGEHLERIFERFYRADPARSRGAGGTGLGLAIVKHLTEAHGGRVGVESELGQGTAVHCWFPR